MTSFGLYLHIPFCRRRCFYCDFYFVTGKHQFQAFTDALILEMDIRKEEFFEKPVHSIYFGGGTPSRLPWNFLDQIFAAIYSRFKVLPDAEITLEANPEDMTHDWLLGLKNSPVNRLSLGIQALHDKTLKYLGRIHTAAQSLNMMDLCLSVGIKNYSVDLIYGVPVLTHEQWVKEIEMVAQWPIQHLSAYALTVEKGTPLDLLMKRGKWRLQEEDSVVQQHQLLMNYAKINGFEWYEISNFARGDAHAVHNTAYWKGLPYLGLGPSAHSFDGIKTRIMNTQKLNSYIQNPMPTEKEILTEKQQIHEWILTGIRQRTGLNWKEAEQRWSEEIAFRLKENAKKQELQKYLEHCSIGIRLTMDGILWSDFVALQLFI